MSHRLPSPFEGQPLTESESEFVNRLVETAFRSYASARLLKLKPHVLDALVKMCSSPKDKVITTIEEKVARILEAKKELELMRKRETETRCSTPSPPEQLRPPELKEAPPVPEATPPVAPVAPVAPVDLTEIPETPETPEQDADPPTKPPKLTANPPTDASVSVVRPVFKKQHEINIVAFNSLKLRLDHEDLKDEWDAAILKFSEYDVLMLSEVRASDKLFKARAQRLVEMLNDCSNDLWRMSHSEPSGPGAKEVHLVIAKDPIAILNVSTMARLGDQDMCHAPLVVSLQDTRFVGELKRFNVISVHMPPKSTSKRRNDRNAQIRKLTSTYASTATTRLDTPFTDKGAKDTGNEAPHVAHIIGGDFNADANELRELGVESHGWEVVLGSVPTSSGGKSYDNWLINRDCKNHLTIGGDVLDLSQYANFSRGRQGISDHSPITLRIKEVPRMAAAPTPTKTRAAIRQAKADAAASSWLESPTKVEELW